MDDKKGCVKEMDRGKATVHIGRKVASVKWSVTKTNRGTWLNCIVQVPVEMRDMGTQKYMYRNTKMQGYMDVRLH